MLNINNLNVVYHNKEENIHAVNNVSMEIHENEIVGMVGESGSGKTSITHAILQTLPKKSEWNGKILFQDHILNSKNIHQFRGKRIAYISQNFFSCLSPDYTIRFQFDLLLKSNLPHFNKKQRRNYIIKLLTQLNFTNPEKVLKMYPFELSGGMIQRIIIALAIAMKPKLLIADEPTTAIDTINKKRFLKILRTLNSEYGITILLISHDLQLIQRFVDRVIVIYQGEIVEKMENEDSLQIMHPYSQLLYNSKFSLKTNVLQVKKEVNNIKSQCSFAKYCSHCDGKCMEKVYQYNQKNHFCKCNLYDRN